MLPVIKGMWYVFKTRKNIDFQGGRIFIFKKIQNRKMIKDFFSTNEPILRKIQHDFKTIRQRLPRTLKP